MSGWIGVDLDGTLAEYHEFISIAHIGKAIEPMLERVKDWVIAGEEVRLFTARWNDTDEQRARFLAAWIQWCDENGLPHLQVTYEKDYHMWQLWDDRCVQVEKNTGVVLGDPSQLESRRQRHS